MMPLAAVPEFFHRFDGLNLTAGNKTAGFDLVVSTEVLRCLRLLPMAEPARVTLFEAVETRLMNCPFLSLEEVARCAIGFVPGTWCPKFFMTGPEAASIGAVPSELSRLPARDALEWIGPTLIYSPHNVDSAQQALALVVMAETWAEQARFALESATL